MQLQIGSEILYLPTSIYAHDSLNSLAAGNYNFGLVLGLKEIKLTSLMDSTTFLDDITAAWLHAEGGSGYGRRGSQVGQFSLKH